MKMKVIAYTLFAYSTVQKGRPQGRTVIESRSNLTYIEALAGTSTPDQRGQGKLRRLSRLTRARLASQLWTGRVRVTFASDSSTAMKHIEDVDPSLGQRRWKWWTRLKRKSRGRRRWTAAS